ncbi:unnamed protein product [Pylaiella littoralis]
MSTDPSQRIGRCHVLRRAAEGVMARLSFLEHHTLQPGGQRQAKPLCLRNPDYAKMRKKIELSFPDQLEAAKAVAFDGHARSVLSELEGVFQVFEDVTEVRDGMVEELRDMSGCRTGMPLKFASDVNPELMMSFMSLMADYVRVHLVVASITERKQALGMYYCAYATVNGKKTNPAMKKVNALMSLCDNPIYGLSVELSAKACDVVRSCVAGALTATREVVEVALEVNTLRGMNALSVLDEGDMMAFPCQLPVSQRSTTVMLHSELQRSGEYVVWVCLMGLVMPRTVLCQAELTELWSLVCRKSLIIPVFRDVTLNLHAEVEKMVAWFPPKNTSLTLSLPTDMKLKKYMKGIAKEAAAGCALTHRERRAYLREQVKALAALVGAEPGMLGPKFPMVLAACKLAKEEIIWYCQHSLQGSGKRASKAVPDPILPDPLTTVLIGELDVLACAIVKYASIIQRYYIEYLKGAHLTSLRKLIQAAIAHTNLEDKVSKKDVARLSGLTAHLECLDPAKVDEADLKEFRWDCYRLLGVLSEPGANLMHDMQVSEMMRRMTRVMEHSEFVDGLESVLRQQCDVEEAWWYYESVLTANAKRCLVAEDSSSKFAASYIKVLGSAINNVHEDCPDEQLIIGTKSADLAEEMAEAIAARVEQLIRMLCNKAESLEVATLPHEAANRAHRQHTAIMQAKKSGGPVPTEPLPGRESEGWNNTTVNSLASVEGTLTNLLTSLNTHAQGVVVFDRLIVPKEYVRERLQKFFRQHLYSITVFDGGVVERPTVTLRKLTTCSAVLQSALARTDIDSAAIIRQVLLDECTDWSQIHGHARKGSQSKEGLSKTASATDGPSNVLDNISRWYVTLLKMISPGGKSSGIVYVPARQGFVASSSAVATAGGGPPVDLFFDLEELRALCTLLGSGGARSVEKAVLDFVATRVRDMQLMLTAKQTALEEFRAGYATKHWGDTLRALGNLGSFVEDAIAIGNALTLRRLLNEALGSVYEGTMPFLRKTVDLGCKAVDAGAGGRGMDAFKRLAGDFGLALKYEDHSLLLALDGCIDTPVWSLLPYAFAASFSSESWRKCEYVSRLGVFKNNEHVMVTTIVELTTAFFGGGGAGGSGDRGPTGGGEAAIRRALEEYVKTASFVLLRLKMRHHHGSDGSSAVGGFKFFCMYAFLDKFIEQCPQVDRSVMEEFIPYALMHAGYLDMSRQGSTSA